MVGRKLYVMNSTLNVKKVRSIVKIEAILSDKELTNFKIGKTDNLKRRMREHEKDGYTNFYEIAECNSLEELNNLERDLISYFKTNSKCANENEGGGGSISESVKYHIYLITK